MSMREFDRAAIELARARRDGSLIDALPAALVPDVAAAGRLQHAATEAYGVPLLGRKIGATARETQERMGTDAPFWGPIFADACIEHGGTLALPPGARGVEVELAFRLVADLPRRPQSYREDEIAEAAGALHLALEIVGARQRLPAAVQAPWAVADFGFNVAFVHGPGVAGWRELDLPAVAARCLIDGEERASGTAGVVLGSPLRALAWLADNGPGLRAGEWVSCGTLTGIVPVRGGQVAIGDFGPLGEVGVRFS